MKIRFPTRSFVSLAACVVLGALASPHPLSGAPAAKLQVAERVAGGTSLDDWIGRSVLGQNGEPIGEIRDFLADEATGELAFAAVATGGVLGLGETLRLLPIHALTIRGTDSAVRVPLAEAELRQMLSLDTQSFTEDRIRLDRSQHAVASRPAGGGLGRGLLRLSVLEGRPVHVGDREVGEVEEVRLDLPNRVARVLFDPQPILSGSEEKVLASLSFFQLPERSASPLQTTLTTSDFRDLYASYNQTAGPKQPLAVANEHREERGLPALDDHQTVNVPHEPEAAITERELRHASTAVREALRVQVADVADRVEVTAADGAVLVRGPVLTPEERTKTEHVARAAAGRMRVEFAWSPQR